MFFRHSHFYRVPFFVFNCLVPIFFVTVIFIRRNFILRCLVQIFLATVIFIRCHFFQLFGSGFFGNSDSLNCIFLSCTVWLIFFATDIFIRCHFLSSTVWLRFFWPLSFLYKAHFFILRCLVQFVLATVVFIRCHIFFQLFCSHFLAAVFL